MKKQNKIQEYIETNFNNRAKILGLEIIFKKEIKLVYPDTEADQFDFEVIGNGTDPYTIVVKRINSLTRQIVSECNCGAKQRCEHEVASLLYLNKSDYFNETPTGKPVTPRADKLPDTAVQNNLEARKTDEWQVILPNARDIAESIFRRQDSMTRVTQFVNSKAWEDNQIKFSVSSYGSNFQHYLVEMRAPTKKRLEIRCNCGLLCYPYCMHQVAVLLNVNSIHKYSAIFEQNEQFSYAQLAKQYGITTQKAKELFKVMLKKDSLVVEPTAEGRDLLPVLPEALKEYAQDMIRQFKLSAADEDMALIDHLGGLSGNGFAYIVSGKDAHSREVQITVATGNLSKTGNALTHLKIAQQAEYSGGSLPAEVQNELFVFKRFANLKFVANPNANVRFRYFTELNTIADILRNKEFLYVNMEGGSNLLSKQSLTPITIANEKAKVLFEVEESEELIQLKISLQIGLEIYPIDDELLNYDLEGFVFMENRLVGFASFPDFHFAFYTYRRSNYQMPIQHAEDFLRDFVLPLGEQFNIDFSGLDNYSITNEALKADACKLYISEVDSLVVLRPMVRYGELEINPSIHQNITEVLGKEIKCLSRDVEHELAFWNLVQGLHPEFATQKSKSYFGLEYGLFLEQEWFFEAFKVLQENNVEVLGLSTLKRLKYSPYKAQINTELKSGLDWFELDITVAFGDNIISLKEVQKAMRKGENFVVLGDGSRGLLPEEWLKKMENYFRAGQLSKDGIKISKYKASIVDELFEGLNDNVLLLEIAKKRAQLNAFENIEHVRVSPKIKADLREYQKAGLNWLNFLDEFGWGGILADDMGLGKTLQILAFLQARSEKTNMPSLVIIPTTLLFNWQNELDKFTSGLKVLLHYGLERTRNVEDFTQYDLIISTYGLLINDIKFFSEITFDYLILDESQAIKNPSSQRYKAACLLKANNRIALTGTPIENNTFDLFAQMNFVNPGIFVSAAHFKENYSLPIDRDRNPERARELQRIIKPFLLRRTKEQVATELPAKTEGVVFCEMGVEQRKVYDAFRNKYREQLLGTGDQAQDNNKLMVLEGLMKLRQICDSPKLLNDEEAYAGDSIKIEELMRHITNKTGKHKVLVFSQFVKMLHLIEAQLQKAKIDFEYLDGKCTQPQREASVNRFQASDDCRVFLISLKAGGTGLNLTAADYVYLVDPWWNPAVENQAIDRCYRIGQDKKVFAYRMICKDTIEEKILDYQAKKRAVADDIITTEESFLKQLSRDDIRDLFG